MRLRTLTVRVLFCDPLLLFQYEDQKNNVEWNGQKAQILVRLDQLGKSLQRGVGIMLEGICF